MAADEVRPRLCNERFQLAHHAALHAANIGDDRTTFERGQHLPHERLHLRQRRAKDDQDPRLKPPRADR
jgi:hypothetical protein